LSKYKRQDFHKQARRASSFDIRAYGVGSAEKTLMASGDAAYLHAMYQNLANRKFRINIFEVPPNVVPAMLESPAWEIVTLSLKPEAGGPAHGRPVAWFAGHLFGGHYGALVAGLDYGYVVEHGVYRQMLFQMVRHSKNRGMRLWDGPRGWVRAVRDQYLRAGSLLLQYAMGLDLRGRGHARLRDRLQLS
jgi:Acetyltransferase (GNAT) domain